MSRLDSRARELLVRREIAAFKEAEADAAKAALNAFESELWSELEDEGLKSTSLELEPLQEEVRGALRDDAQRLLRLSADVVELGNTDRARELVSAALDTLQRAEGPGYGTVRLDRKKTIYHQIIDKRVLESALRQRGLDREYLRDDFRKGALNQFVRTELEAGRELPAGLGYREDKYISVTKKPGR